MAEFRFGLGVVAAMVFLAGNLISLGLSPNPHWMSACIINWIVIGLLLVNLWLGLVKITWREW